ARSDLAHSRSIRPESTAPAPVLSSISTPWTSRIRVRKDFKPARRTQTRAESFSFREARACIATERWLGDSALAATAWTKTITSPTAEQPDLQLQHRGAPTRCPT